MSRKWIAIWMIWVGLSLLFATQAIPAQAQEVTPENDANCVSCHEHQYYLYDSGKWFCLCDAPMHCVYCHSGRTDTLDKALAHEGLVLYPTRDHAERCQSCHAEDYMARVVTFTNVAGISATPRPIITATPFSFTKGTVEQQPSALLHIAQLEPWQYAGLGALAVALVGIFWLGVKFNKADSLARRQS